MKASFVIVNYNRKDEILLTILKTKELVKHNASNYEIVVVDNASTDGSADAIKVQYPDVVLIENPVNTGAPAWNLGFQKAQGQYFIILDDDSHIESGLEDAIRYLDENSKVGILALNISGGAYQTKHWHNLEEKVGFIGCGAIFRKELYDKIGGYADWIFLYSNEWDLGIRAIEAGYKVIYFEKCKVTHRASIINRTSKRLIVYTVRNEMGIVYKHFSKDTRDAYARRVFFNNLKGVKKYGLPSIGWYWSALKEFNKMKHELPHTPVKKEVEDLYIKKFWSTKPFFKHLFVSAD
jgi:GT2 family glycosyltransferase